MHFFVRKLYDLVFNRRTVARPDRLNLSAVHRRTVDVFANDAVRLQRGPCDVAGNLRVVMCHSLRAKTKRSGILIAGLKLKSRPIDRAPVKPWRRTGLQPASSQAEPLESFT